MTERNSKTTNEIILEYKVEILKACLEIQNLRSQLIEQNFQSFQNSQFQTAKIERLKKELWNQLNKNKTENDVANQMDAQ